MDIYKSIIENAPVAYAMFKIVDEQKNGQYDFEFLEVNEAFEKLCGLSRNKLINKSLLQITKSSKKDDFDWIGYSRQFSLGEPKIEFVQYSKPLNKWYRVYAYVPEKGTLVTVFADITNEKIQEKAFHELSAISEDFLNWIDEEIDYQKVMDNILEISEAKYGAFNIYDEDGQHYTTTAISGNKALLKEAMKLISMKLENRKWDHDPKRADKIKDKTVTVFSNLCDLAGDIIPKPMCDLLTSTFNIGVTVVVKIMRNNVILGDLTLMMSKDKTFDKEPIIGIFALQLGLMIDRKNTEARLKVSEKRFRELVLNLDAGVVIHSTDSAIIDCNDRASELLRLSREQLMGRSTIDPVWMFVDETEQKIPLEEYPINLILNSLKPLKNKLVGIRHSTNKNIVWVMVNGVPIVNNKGNLLEAVISFIDFTELKNSRDNLAQSEEQYRLLTTQMQLGLALHEVVVDEKENVSDYRFIGANQAFENMTGLNHTEIIGKSVLDVLPQTNTNWIQKVGRVALTGESIFTETYSDELQKYFEVAAYSPKHGQFATIISDITSRKQIEKQLQQNVADLLESQRIARLGTWRLNLSNNEVVWSEELYKMYGFDPKQPVPPYTQHMKLFTSESWNRLSTALEKTRLYGTAYELELETVTKEGSNGWMWVRGEAERDSDGKIITLWGAAQDITEHKRIQSELIFLSYHDHLSGLNNRRYFEEALLKIDTPENLPISIIMCDVNGLKMVNDSFGHHLGDELLKRAAHTISKVGRKNDVIARIGGDEFVVLLPNTTAYETVHIANQMKELASKETIANIELSISYGYDTKTFENQSITEVLSNAENYMYRHKLYERSSIRSKTIDLIMNALFEKSNREAMHSTRVSNLCQMIATNMNFNENAVNQMKIAGLIHDIGKIGVDEKILNKQASLNEEERREVERHPEIGWRLLSSTSEYSELALFILNHHEKWDGSGYPNGLKGEAIPLEARIISVADAYDAMTSERSYHKAVSKEDAILELTSRSGTQFDPVIVDVFVNRVL
jgi:diguanylate cyclase (GGDEF)-like protein/PAS domain S-box-containing protein